MGMTLPFSDFGPEGVSHPCYYHRSNNLNLLQISPMQDKEA